MKSILLTAVAMFAILAIPFPAKASLGGTLASVQADQTHLRGTLRSINNGTYTVQEVKAPTGIVVREYVSTSSGTVFAITWQGPARPDLRQLLGTYSQTLKQAMQAHQGHRVGLNSLVVKQPGLVVEMGGHMRWLVGRAYVPGMMPPDVQLEEIR